MLTDIVALRRMAEDSDFARYDPWTRMDDRPKTRRWPTERLLKRDGLGVWFSDRDADYIAALSPRNTLTLLDELAAVLRRAEAAEADWQEAERRYEALLLHHSEHHAPCDVQDVAPITLGGTDG